ncbi:MAG: glucose-6-phosphate dehydrogenase [Patescibacteria group bacterium]|jgi:glucose-6-phosphate 1-dehydrogenase
MIKKPTTLVIFGITGDLVKTKLLWALFNLFLQGKLPKKDFLVLGLSRRDWDDNDLRAHLEKIMIEEGFPRKSLWNDFLAIFSYFKADFTCPSSFVDLAKRVRKIDRQASSCTNKLYYLAVSPHFYQTILVGLKENNLVVTCNNSSWTRIALEKPFGQDLPTAKKLDQLLGSLFAENQVYRIDHYLAKENLRNILALRFDNTFLTPIWNKQFIDKVEVRLWEKEKVADGRTAFYDGLGALRDVGQNHLLQFLALLTMDQPQDSSSGAIRKTRAKALKNLAILSPGQVEKKTVRAQYDGYRNQLGVKKNSSTETYFRISTVFSDGNLAGVPLILEAGKAMKKNLVEAKIFFKQPSKCFHQSSSCQNVLVYRVKPKETIFLTLLVKKPGLVDRLSEAKMSFDYRANFDGMDFASDYEKLLLDILAGDQTLFVSTDEVMAQWRFVEPIIKSWQKGKPKITVKNDHG